MGSKPLAVFSHLSLVYPAGCCWNRQEGQDIWVFWDAGQVTKNPPFLRGTGDGRTRSLGHRDTSASSWQLEQHQNAHGKCWDLCSVTAAGLLLRSAGRCFGQNKRILSVMFWTENVITSVNAFRFSSIYSPGEKVGEEG